jgi:hypothetical protein
MDNTFGINQQHCEKIGTVQGTTYEENIVIQYWKICLIIILKWNDNELFDLMEKGSRDM